MSGEAAYAIDTNVLVEAHRRYYGFDICPGYWNAILSGHDSGEIRSVDRVKAEIERQNDDLNQWVQDSVPDDFFEDTDDPDIITSFGELMQCVQDQDQFRPEAKEEFAASDNADGWLIAYAKVSGRVIVTHEKYSVYAQKRVPIPNVCEAFSIPCENTFEMLRALKARFE